MGLLAALALTACTVEEPAPAATPVPEAVTDPGPPPPPGATGEPAIGITELPPVPVGQPAAFGGGLSASVLQVEPAELTADVPGEIAGPGAAVTLEMRNDGPEAVDLSGVVVNAYYADRVPATENTSPPAEAFGGPLAGGESRRGVYLFRVPADDLAGLLVEVNYNGSPNVVTIRN